MAENSGGAHCLKHGFTVNHVTGAKVVLPDGELVELGGKALDAATAPICSACSSARRARSGSRARSRSGSCAQPEAVVTLLAAFRLDRRGRRRRLAHRRRRDPAGRDGDDGPAHDRGGRGGRSAPATRPARAPCCSSSSTASRRRSRTTPRPSTRSAARAARSRSATASDDAERALLWRGRKGAFAAMGRVSPDYYVQDGVVPRTKLPDGAAADRRAFRRARPPRRQRLPRRRRQPPPARALRRRGRGRGRACEGRSRTRSSTPAWTPAAR